MPSSQIRSGRVRRDAESEESDLYSRHEDGIRTDASELHGVEARSVRLRASLFIPLKEGDVATYISSYSCISRPREKNQSRMSLRGEGEGEALCGKLFEGAMTRW